MVYLPQEKQGHTTFAVGYFGWGEVTMQTDPWGEIPLNLSMRAPRALRGGLIIFSGDDSAAPCFPI